MSYTRNVKILIAALVLVALVCVAVAFPVSYAQWQSDGRTLTVSVAVHTQGGTELNFAELSDADLAALIAKANASFPAAVTSSGKVIDDPENMELAVGESVVVLNNQGNRITDWNDKTGGAITIDPVTGAICAQVAGIYCRPGNGNSSVIQKIA